MSTLVQSVSAAFKVTAPIKLIVWDMDDTFWQGTLSEGGVTLVERNIEIVRTLVDRGIMSSISSKNDLASVQAVLSDAGIWDHFIFPQVSWSAKGGAIETIVEQANLRPDNVLFIDDNPLNLEEIRFRFPTMMVAHPDDVLAILLDLKEAKGKDDRGHSRLQQYKQLEQKVADQTRNAASNEDFLRQCDIRLRLEFDVVQHLDRIIELINRSNQLNYTKVRLEEEDAVARFKQDLQRHDIMSAAIFATDRYGDHGLIGFYMQHRNEQQNRLLHYVWSCRMMNAGLEQYVYERLGSPTIEVVGPVSNPIVTFGHVDWVREVQGDDAETPPRAAPRLVLIGSCDLTAVASYCSANRAEFVNGIKDGIMTRYDDFGFLLDDPENVRASKAIDRLPCWSSQDFASFHAELPVAEVLILSLSAAMKGAYLVTDDDVVARIHPEGFGHHIDAHPWADFLEGCSFYALNTDQRTQLLERSLAFVARYAAPGASKFLLGANTRDVGGALSASNLETLTHYNLVAERFCAGRADWTFISINDVVAYEKLVDDRHYTRLGYFDIANHINARITTSEGASTEPAQGAPDAFDLASFVRSGRKLSRFSVFGSERMGQGVVATSRRVLNRSLKWARG